MLHTVRWAWLSETLVQVDEVCQCYGNHWIFDSIKKHPVGFCADGAGYRDEPKRTCNIKFVHYGAGEATNPEILFYQWATEELELEMQLSAREPRVQFVCSHCRTLCRTWKRAQLAVWLLLILLQSWTGLWNTHGVHFFGTITQFYIIEALL